jgi:hypothetical protein
MQLRMRLSSRDELGTRAAVERPAQLGEAQGELGTSPHLADERLRRATETSSPARCEQHAVGVARGLRAHDCS